MDTLQRTAGAHPGSPPAQHPVQDHVRGCRHPEVSARLRAIQGVCRAPGWTPDQLRDAVLGLAGWAGAHQGAIAEIGCGCPVSAAGASAA